MAYSGLNSVAVLLCAALTIMFQGQNGIEAATQTDRYNLTSYLFDGYKPQVRPTSDGNATYVYIEVQLLSVQNLDERGQELETALIIDTDWTDDFLSWNPSDFGGLTYILYPQEYVWLPDVVVENSVERRRQLGYDENKVMIDATGYVRWKPSVVTKTGCDINIKYYPFDTQTCNIIISTWMSTKDEIDIDPLSGINGLGLSKYSKSGTWELVGNSLEILPDNEDLTRIQFTIKLKRLRTYYILNIIMPVIFLSITACMVFYLPADAGEKIGMGITVLLAYSVYLTIIADNIPQTSLQVSYLAVYLTTLLGLTALGVVLAVIVLHLHHKPEECEIGPKTESVTRAMRGFLRIRQDQVKVVENNHNSNNNNNKPERYHPDPRLEMGRRVPYIHEPYQRVGRGPPGRFYSVPEVRQPDPSPDYRTMPEEITWPKVAETMDRAMFFLTSFLIVAVTVIFFTILAVGD